MGNNKNKKSTYFLFCFFVVLISALFLAQIQPRKQSLHTKQTKKEGMHAKFQNEVHKQTSPH